MAFPGRVAGSAVSPDEGGILCPQCRQAIDDRVEWSMPWTMTAHPSSEPLDLGDGEAQDRPPTMPRLWPRHLPRAVWPVLPPIAMAEGYGRGLMKAILALASIGQGSLGTVTDCAAARFRVWCLFAVWTAVACAARRARVRTGSDRAG